MKNIENFCDRGFKVSIPDIGIPVVLMKSFSTLDNATEENGHIGLGSHLWSPTQLAKFRNTAEKVMVSLKAVFWLPARQKNAPSSTVNENWSVQYH